MAVPAVVISSFQNESCVHFSLLNSMWYKKRICTFQTVLMTISSYYESKPKPTKAESKTLFTSGG